MYNDIIIGIIIKIEVQTENPCAIKDFQQHSSLIIKDESGIWDTIFDIGPH